MISIAPFAVYFWAARESRGSVLLIAAMMCRTLEVRGLMDPTSAEEWS